MKNSLFLLLIIPAFLSCKSNTRKVAGDSITKKLPNDSSQTLIKRFKPIIQGIWVNNDYLTELKKSQSPYQCFKTVGVDLIQIGISDDLKDSVIANESNGHEPSSFTIFFKYGQKLTSLKTNMGDKETSSDFYDLGYDIKQNDTSLIIYHYDQTNNFLGKTEYTKVLDLMPGNTDVGFGINFITNKILIAGTYTVIDSTGKRFNAIFNNNGTVSEFLNFKTFYINTDFEAAPENSIDEISFDINSKTQKNYAFKFNADTLSLYKTNMDADSTLFIKERAIFKLIRIK